MDPRVKEGNRSVANVPKNRSASNRNTSVVNVMATPPGTALSSLLDVSRSNAADESHFSTPGDQAGSLQEASFSAEQLAALDLFRATMERCMVSPQEDPVGYTTDYQRRPLSASVAASMPVLELRQADNQNELRYTFTDSWQYVLNALKKMGGAGCGSALGQTVRELLMFAGPGSALMRTFAVCCPNAVALLTEYIVSGLTGAKDVGGFDPHGREKVIGGNFNNLVRKLAESVLANHPQFVAIGRILGVAGVGVTRATVEQLQDLRREFSKEGSDPNGPLKPLVIDLVLISLLAATVRATLEVPKQLVKVGKIKPTTNLDSMFAGGYIYPGIGSAAQQATAAAIQTSVPVQIPLGRKPPTNDSTPNPYGGLDDWHLYQSMNSFT